MARVSVPFTVGEGFANNNNTRNPSHHFFAIAGFADWLVAQGKRKRTVRDTIFYAKKFAYVLDTGDATPIMTQVKPLSQKHVLSALANLSKYQGRYDRWQQIRRNHSLHWAKTDSTTHLQRFFDEGLTLDTMLSRIREMMSVLPTSMSKIIKFGVLVGLRSSEIIESVRLINNNDKEAFTKYYNSEQMTLSHFKFPEIYLRTTKKAFLSFVTPDMLSIVQNLDKKIPSINAISHACQRRHIPCNTRYCRKIYATYLHEKGIPVEIIDALQGRTPTSIFAKHYYKPSLSYKQKVLDALNELRKQIES